jgi:hypothetical protein
MRCTVLLERLPTVALRATCRWRTPLSPHAATRRVRTAACCAAFRLRAALRRLPLLMLLLPARFCSSGALAADDTAQLAAADSDSCADASDVVFFDMDDTLIDVNRRGRSAVCSLLSQRLMRVCLLPRAAAGCGPSTSGTSVASPWYACVAPPTSSRPLALTQFCSRCAADAVHGGVLDDKIRARLRGGALQRRLFTTRSG